jgi:phage N-6-adenine-methyltransferase
MSAKVSSGKDSKQNYGTPWDFVLRVQKAWGIPHFDYDLAADGQNAKGTVWIDKERDSLAQDWSRLRGKLWLNPPYADIAPWVEKCYRSTREPGRNIFVLIPASVGSNWYRDWVHTKCDVYFLNPRLKFDGATSLYPRDLMLCVYGGMDEDEVKDMHPPSVWNWKDGTFDFGF